MNLYFILFNEDEVSPEHDVLASLAERIFQQSVFTRVLFSLHKHTKFSIFTSPQCDRLPGEFKQKGAVTT